MIRRRKQYKYIINITSIEDRFEVIRTIAKPFTFKIHIKMFAKAGPNKDPIATPSREINSFRCSSLILKVALLTHEFIFS